ncbi:hypothetical protein SCA6_011087, partial [Theobroma cacao]
NKKP